MTCLAYVVTLKTTTTTRQSLFLYILTISYKSIKFQGNNFNWFLDILLTNLQFRNFQRAITQENNSDLFQKLIRSSAYHPLSAV